MALPKPLSAAPSEHYKGYEIEKRGKEWVIVYDRAPKGEHGDIISGPFANKAKLLKEIERRIRARRKEDKRELEAAARSRR